MVTQHMATFLGSFCCWLWHTGSGQRDRCHFQVFHLTGLSAPLVFFVLRVAGSSHCRRRRWEPHVEEGRGASLCLDCSQSLPHCHGWWPELGHSGPAAAPPHYSLLDCFKQGNLKIFAHFSRSPELSFILHTVFAKLFCLSACGWQHVDKCLFYQRHRCPPEHSVHRAAFWEGCFLHSGCTPGAQCWPS